MGCIFEAPLSSGTAMATGFTLRLVCAFMVVISGALLSKRGQCVLTQGERGDAAPLIVERCDRIREAMQRDGGVERRDVRLCNASEWERHAVRSVRHVRSEVTFAGAESHHKGDASLAMPCP